MPASKAAAFCQLWALVFRVSLLRHVLKLGYCLPSSKEYLKLEEQQGIWGGGLTALPI
jgi:hypothetical protein